MELVHVITNRRSQRKFTDYQVTDEEIKQLLKSAAWAPSWANTQVWEFIVIRDRELIKKITGTYTDNNPAIKCSMASSAMIVACAKLNVSGHLDPEINAFREWSMFDVGCAVQNLSLRACDLGLGTVIVASLDHRKLKELLNIPEGYETVAVLPLGKPVHPEKTAPRRREMKDFCHENKFGTPYE